MSCLWLIMCVINYRIQRGCVEMQISAHPLKLCKSNKMQGAEIEDDGSVLKYMTKSEIEKQRSSLLIMTQRLYFSFATGASEITSSNRCS